MVSTSLNPALPPKLGEIITKALEKDDKLRYQSATDIRIDLQRLKRDTESARLSAETVARLRVGKPWKVLVPAGALVLAAMAGGASFYFHRTPKLTVKDTIVLADFTNTTGDSVFDGTLRQGLSAQLQQSPFLSLVSDDRVAQTLTLMTKPKDTRVTPDVARDVCQRTASAATIEGSVSSLGSQYVLDVKAVNCHTGDLLAEKQATANGKDQVLQALGDVASKLRSALGESLASVQKYDALPENVTTSSLEALQEYTLGEQAADVKNDYTAAIAFFQRAISLDPNFAMAYLALAESYQPFSELDLSTESARKAYELRDRTSEREKLAISSFYQLVVTGNLEAARGSYELWAQTYPRDEEPEVNLWLIYAFMGNYDKAHPAARQALDFNPGSSNNYVSLVYSYQWINQLNESKATAQEAYAKKLNSPWLPLVLYNVGFLQHDAAGMDTEAAASMGIQGIENQMYFLESETAAEEGEFARSRELTNRAADSAKRYNEGEAAAEYLGHGAVREALAGNMDFAKKEAQAALATANTWEAESLSSVAVGLAGDSTQAGRLAADLDKRDPENTIVRFIYLPMIHAALALNDGDGKRAVDALAVSAPYELGETNASFTFALYPVYLRGEAYLAAKQGAEAATEFHKILDHSGVVGNEPIGALAHLGLARAYAMTGETAKARAAYQDFLALWKGADPDIPILKEAKTEYARLQ